MPDDLTVYAGRAPGIQPVSLSLDREAVQLVAKYAPTPKARGRFLSRLVYEHAARVEERERLRRTVKEVLDD